MKKIDLQAYMMQENSIRNKDLRKQLMAQDPHCYYCGIEVKDDYESKYRILKKGETQPDDMATIEHLYDRYDPRRYQNHNNKKKVLSCYKCNHTRNLLRDAAIPKHLRDERARLARLRKKGEPRPLIFFKDL